MAIAWCYSKIYIRFPEYLKDYLIKNKQKNSMSDSELFIHNKTIQKICDSYQVKPYEKEDLKKLRVHN